MGRLFNSKQFRNDLSLSGSFSGSFQGDGSLLANIGAGIPAISASYAITASYAISASHEIIKEISSSHANTADTASYINPLQQDVHLTGSLYITGSGNISLTSGSAFSITEPDSDQQGRLDFSFTNGDPILEVGSRSNIAYLNLRKGFTGDAFKIGSDGTFIVDGTTTIQLNSSQFKPNTTNTIDLGVFNRRFKDVFLYSGAKLGWSANTAADLIGFQHVAGTNQLQVTGSAAGIRLDVKGTVSASLFSGSFQGNGSGLTNIPASGITGLNLSRIASGSATASIAPDKGFIVNTNAKITGSLTISGSHNSDILLPNAPTNAIRISGSNDRTRLHIYDSVENSTPVYTEGAGIVLTGGDDGSQATLELSAVGSGNGGGNNEQSYIHSNQMITLTGADNDAGYHVKLAGAFGGMFLTANTSNTIGHFYSNGGGTPAGIRLGQVDWAHIKSTGNAAYVKIGKNDTEDWQDINNTRTIFSGNISGSTTSTSSFGTYLGDGSQLTGIISSSYAVSASYAISSSHEIIKEVSSSYADTASFAQSGNGVFSGSFSGSFQGNGSGITNIPASGITGLNLSRIASGSVTASIAPDKGLQINTNTQITGSLTISGSFIPQKGDNIIIGKGAAGSLEVGGERNIIMGESSSRGLTTGDDNITIGYHAGRRDTNTESKNIFLGSYTGEFGDQNSSILIGAYNGRYGNGSSNVYIGNQTGTGHSGDSSTSNYNVFLGAGIASYWGLTSATNNVAVGYQAGRYFTDNDGNTLIGYQAGHDLRYGDYNILIGHENVGVNSTNFNNQLRIGNGIIHAISGSLTTGDLIFASTASAAYFVGDGSQLTGITSGIFQQTGSYYATTNDLQITGSLLVTGSITGVQGVTNSLTASYSITSSHAVTASYVDIESLPLINPIVKYYNVAEITSSGTTVPLPDSLTFVSSSVYEYLEVFINGLRLRYDMDFLPTSNTTIKYLVTIPSGSEITYKSLKRP